MSNTTIIEIPLTAEWLTVNLTLIPNDNEYKIIDTGNLSITLIKHEEWFKVKSVYQFLTKDNRYNDKELKFVSDLKKIYLEIRGKELQTKS